MRKKASFKLNSFQFLRLASAALILAIASFIPIRIAIALYQAPFPQAIFTLGGDAKREEAAAKLASAYPSLNIWVSSGIPPAKASEIFHSQGISNSRVHLDYRAKDTVTNFTTLVNDFKKRNLQHLYLITSDFHIWRAKAIATIVLGSQGIVFTPVTVSSKHPPESWFSILRDICRALLWVFTGDTGYSLISKL
jgi:uncharacterized SAM-binding protein YcdF (DUF218 family)